MNTLQMLTILIELAVAVIGGMIAIEKKKFYGWCILLTFTCYVIYDIARLLAIEIPADTLRVIFFIASLSILIAIWQIYSIKLKKN